MKNQTSPAFNTQETIRKYSGVRLSPSARITAARKLKAMIAPAPQKVTVRKVAAAGSSSGGVPSSRSIGRAANSPIAVIASAMPPETMTPAAM